MKKIKVGVLGATGLVGQRICSMLVNHPWFEIADLTGKTSVGKIYGETVNWLIPSEIPDKILNIKIKSSNNDKLNSDILFSALPSSEAKQVEGKLAEKGHIIVSNASSHRMDVDVPLIVGEINSDHLKLIDSQKEKRGYKGFITTNPNCSTINLVLALKPIQDLLGINKIFVTTMQALSGAGYPGVSSMQIIDNVIPYIEGEEEKLETETQKILGKINQDKIKNATFPVAASCNRVNTVDGHLLSVYIETKIKMNLNDVIDAMTSFKGFPQDKKLPSAPLKPILYTQKKDRPQPRLDRLSGSVPGMSITVGRLRKGIDDKSLQLSVLGHNTIRGAAGTNILLGEILVANGMVNQ